MDFRQEITDKIIAAIESGTAPWQKPWTVPDGLNPTNPVTGTKYRGVNHILLAMAGYGDDRWMTFKQASDKGYKIKKGAKGHKVIKYVELNRKEEDEEDEYKHMVMKQFIVFNGEDIEGLPPREKPTSQDGVERVFKDEGRVESLLQALTQQTGLEFVSGGNRAFYRPSTDSLHMPPKVAFTTETGYYSTLLHEAGHSTMHEKRLNRKEGMEGRFGSAAYAMEELRAEIASCFLCAELGIPLTQEHIDSHAAYVGSWLEALKKDKNEIFKASSDANKITDYLKTFDLEYKAKEGVNLNSLSEIRNDKTVEDKPKLYAVK